MNYLHLKKIPIFPGLIMRYIRVIYSCDVRYGTSIGKGVLFKHNGLGVVVHPKSIIGDYTQIYQNVSIAGRNGRGAPVIGNNVFIGAGACILGGIVIGNNVSIGANSVVIDNVPDDAVVVGIPGKIVKYNKKD